MNNNLNNENYPPYFNKDEELYDNMINYVKKYRPTYGKSFENWMYKLETIQAMNKFKDVDIYGKP
jgi:hypothetical protein